MLPGLPDEIVQPAAHGHIVYIGGIHAAQDIAPPIGLAEGGQDIGPGNEGGGQGRILGRGHLQHHARIMQQLIDEEHEVLDQIRV